MPRLRHVLLATLAVLPSHAWAQGQSGGELLDRLNATTGVERVPLLIELAKEKKGQPREVLQLTEEALALLVSTSSPAEECVLLIERGWAFNSVGEFPSALEALTRALELAERGRLSEQTALALHHVAFVQWRMSNYEEALALGRRALELQQSRGLDAQLAATWTLLGAVHRARGEYEDALACHLEALGVSEELADEHGVARAHSNVGLLYMSIGRHDEARQSLSRTVETYRQLGSKKSLGTALNNLGLTLLELELPGEALAHFEEGLALYEELGSPFGRATLLSGLGFAHAELGNHEQALESHRQALRLRERMGDRRGLSRSLGSLAQVHQQLEQHSEAIELLERALVLSEQVDARSEQAGILEMLAASHSAVGESERALEEFRRFHELQSELIGAETKERIAELEAKHDKERRERDIADLESEAAVRSAELEKQKANQRFLLVGSSLLAASLTLLFVLYRLRVRALRAKSQSHERLKLAAARLAESEERYHALFRDTGAPTFLVDVEGRDVIEFNGPAAQLCSAEAGGASPTPLADLEPEWVRVLLSHAIDAGKSGEVALDESWVEASGEIRWTEIRSSAVSLDGRASLLVILRDVTEEHLKQAARMRTDRIESLGILAGGIAHDFNNALTSITGHISLARDDCADRDPAIELLDLANQSAAQARRLTLQLLAFARGGDPVREVRAIPELLKDGIQFGSAGASLRVETEIAQDLWPVSVDDGQFGQVVSNLVINAKQSMESDGRLLVRATNFRGDPRSVPPRGDQRFVRIDFEDNGCGIPEEEIERIFDPYYTTKPGGSGLGLATAFAVVENHDGYLTVRSRPGVGSQFSVFLPAADALPTRGAHEIPETMTGTGRILILEDEPMVQSVYEAMLSRSGFTPELVADGADAVALYANRLSSDHPFDLVIMDLTVPGGMGGLAALEAIREIDPDVLAIVASGYSDRPTMARHEEAGFKAALPKPFGRKELIHTVQVVLANRPTPV